MRARDPPVAPIHRAAKTDADGLHLGRSRQFEKLLFDLAADAGGAFISLHRDSSSFEDFCGTVTHDKLQLGSADFDREKMRVHGSAVKPILKDVRKRDDSDVRV